MRLCVGDGRGCESEEELKPQEAGGGHGFSINGWCVARAEAGLGSLLSHVSNARHGAPMVVRIEAGRRTSMGLFFDRVVVFGGRFGAGAWSLFVTWR